MAVSGLSGQLAINTRAEQDKWMPAMLNDVVGTNDDWYIHFNGIVDGRPEIDILGEDEYSLDFSLACQDRIDIARNSDAT
jgi:hypothetical protein